MTASNVIIAVAALVAVQAQGQPPAPGHSAGFVAQPVAILQAPDDSPMLMPTAVAVAPTGRVFVADGINDRIVEFDVEGRHVGSFDGVEKERLSRPISLKVDAEGNLWIADTGNGRVLVRDAAGGLLRTITGPAGADLTDLALGGGQTLWLIDNDGHQVLRHDLASGEVSPYGMRGEARGQFQYPFMAAVDRSGILYVTDVINGRVQGLVDFNTIPRAIGSYGVEPGQFHRPKGIALNADGRIIVADGSVGAVQFFASDGTFLGALRDPSGAVMHFDYPCGIAVHGGNLYVTELHLGRVQKLRLESGQAMLAFEPPRTPQPHRQPPTCTACHLEWMPHFGTGEATELASPPPSRPDEPYVASFKSCATCHDGSVVDSRQKVWREHGHRTGVSPPPGMSVPRDMPLVNDKLACRTCHSAHTHGGAGQSMEDAVFLRVDTHPDELCVRCHTAYQGVGVGGMHPTRSFEKPLPPELVAVGSRYSFEPVATGCLVCHTGHGSKADRLLIPLSSTDQMCRACHAHVIQAAPTEIHPLTATLSPAQRTHVTAMGARPTAEGSLQCLSCHKVHYAQDESALLARPRAGSSLCLECHSNYSMVSGTAHDLSFGLQESGAAVAACEVAGPCASCHGVHSLPREPVVTAIDREGSCITCHQAGSCAESRTGQPTLHPVEVPRNLLDQFSDMTSRSKGRSQGASLTCLSCHNPHDSRHQPFLRASRDAVCSACHAENSPVRGGPHDFSLRPDQLNARAQSAERTGSCGFCHAVHNPAGPALWNATSTPPASANALCTDCHSGAAMAPAPPRLLHPIASPVPAPTGAAVLFDARGKRREEGGVLACATCHNPHAAWSAEQPAMLRVAPNLPSHEVCVQCHDEMAVIALSAHHDVAHASGIKSQPEACASCHAVHEREVGLQPDIGEMPLGTEARCTACHHEGGPAKLPHYEPHPRLPMASSHVDSRGWMPLIDPAGNPGPVGVISCITCHVPHGRPVGGGFDPHGAKSPAALSAQKGMLRPYLPPNLCSSCHAFDGLRRFLYFHSPDRPHGAARKAQR